MHLCACIHVYMRVHACIFTYACARMCTSANICTCFFIYVYIHSPDTYVCSNTCSLELACNALWSDRSGVGVYTVYSYAYVNFDIGVCFIYIYIYMCKDVKQRGSSSYPYSDSTLGKREVLRRDCG